MYQPAKHWDVPDAVGHYQQHAALINEDLNLLNICACTVLFVIVQEAQTKCVRNSSTVPPTIEASWEPSTGLFAAHLVSSAAGCKRWSRFIRPVQLMTGSVRGRRGRTGSCWVYIISNEGFPSVNNNTRRTEAAVLSSLSRKTEEWL